jgi:hypothetical protein
MTVALDTMTMGVQAANSAVRRVFGAPAEALRAESAGKRSASPGKSREMEKSKNKREATGTMADG